MALRSTIVYPLGTIAVQMGAPENLALLRENTGAGLIVALVVAMFVATLAWAAGATVLRLAALTFRGTLHYGPAFLSCSGGLAGD